MRRLVVFLALTSLIAGILGVIAPAASAGDTVGSFEIDGNLVDDPAGGPIDWSTPPPNLTNFTDDSGSADDGFGGGSKNDQPATWKCTGSSSPNKVDIKAGQIAFRTLPTGPNGAPEQYVYVNYTRAENNGDSHMDYELNQSSAANPNCPQLPARTNGDIVLTFDTERGGAVINVGAFRWVGNATSGSFQLASNLVKGTTWDGAVNIPNTIPDHIPGDFGEAALNLTRTIGEVQCGQFASAYMKTRSSTSINSALQDRTVTKPVAIGECPDSNLAKAVRNFSTNGAFDTTATANPGEILEYRLTYTNDGTATATGVVVTDVIQAKQTLVAGSCSPACTGTGTAADPLRWTFASVAPGGTQTMFFRVTLDSSGWSTTSPNTVKNIAVVDSDTETPENSNETTTTVTAIPNSSVVKQVRNETTSGTFASTASASPGDIIEYKITYTNTGNVPLTNVTISDTIQGKQTFLTCSNTCTQTGNPVTSISWNLGTVNPGVSVDRTFRVRLDASFPAGTTEVRNVAVSDSNEEPPEESPPTIVTVDAIVNSSVVKQVRNETTSGTFASTASASPGDIIEYKITYTNTGNVPLTNVTISDTIQGKQTFLTCSNTCTQTGNPVTSISWNLGTVNPGVSVDRTFRVRLDASFPAGTTEVRNVAVSDSDQEPPKDSPPTIITVTANPNLGLVKSGSSVDTRITYTITYSNTGNAPATGVTINDTLPAGTTFVSCSQNPPCTTTGQPVTSVSWNIGTVAPGGGGSVTLTLDITGTNGCEICNVASISSPDQTGGARNSNQACVTVTPAPNPAGAHASGNATGANVFSSLLGLDLTLPQGNDGPTDHTSVDSSQAVLGSDSEENALLEILPPPGDAVLRANVLRAVSTSTVTSNPARASAISVGSAANVNILNGVVTATLVRGVASAEATGTSVNVNSLGSAIEGLTVLGIPQAVFPGAVVDLDALSPLFGPGSYVAIYEEVKNTSTPPGTSGGTYAGDITVNMIRVHITGMLVVGAVEVVVGHARAQADFPQTTLCGPQANQSVSGDAFMARLLTDPSIAPVLVGAVQLPTSGGAASNSVNTIVVDPVLTSRAATTSTSGGFTPLNTTATSSAEVKGLCLLETAGVCTIEARVVRAQANSNATGASRTSNPTGTEFLGLKIASLAVSLPVPANTVIAVPGLGFVILNEQFCDNGGTLASNCSNGTVPGHTGITVRAIHVVLLEPRPGGTPGVDLIVAEAHSDARYV